MSKHQNVHFKHMQFTYIYQLYLRKKEITNKQSNLIVAQMVKCLSAMQETRVQSLGWEDPPEKEMAPHSGTLAWKIPWMEKPVGYSLWGHKESDMTERLHFHFHFVWQKKGIKYQYILLLFSC